MSKKVLIGLLLIGGLIAIHGVGVDAHLAGTTYTPTYRHISSYDCTAHLSQVPNPDAHPARFECQAIATEFEALCQNPNGVVTFGNNIRIASSVGSGNLTSGDLLKGDKNKGKAVKTVPLDNSVEVAAGEACAERNRNWIFADEFVTKVDVFLRTFDLVCPAGEPRCSVPTVPVQAFEAWVHCDRPINPANDVPYTLDPAVNNPPPSPNQANWPTSYPCFPVVLSHCDKGGTCPIPYDPSMFALRQEGSEQPYSLNAGLHSLWNQTRRALSMDRSEPQLTKLAPAMRNTPNM